MQLSTGDQSGGLECKLPCDLQLVRDLLLGGPVQVKSVTDLTDQQRHGEMVKGEGIEICDPSVNHAVSAAEIVVNVAMQPSITD